MGNLVGKEDGFNFCKKEETFRVLVVDEREKVSVCCLGYLINEGEI